MHPRLGSWGGITFYGYGTCLVLAAPVCLVVLAWLLRSRSRPLTPAVDLSIAALVGYWLGARLLFAGVQGNIADVWAGPGVSGAWGGQIAFGALSVAYLGLARRNLRDNADALAVAWAFLTVPVKLGCFLAGCCYGAPTTLPWALRFPADGYCGLPGLPIHPTQLYDAASALILGIALLIAFRRSAARGRLILWFGLGYSLLKLASERARGDLRIPVSGSWTASMLIEIGSAGLAGLLLFLGGAWDRVLERMESKEPAPAPPPHLATLAEVLLSELAVAGVAVLAALLLGAGRRSTPTATATYFAVWVGLQFLLGRRVATREGRPATPPQRLARGLTQGLATVTVIGFLRPWFDPSRRTAGDALADTWRTRNSAAKDVPESPK